MADFNSSLPVRTQTNGDVAVKVVDGTLVSQALSIDSSGRVIVKLDDSAGNGITSTLIGSKQALDVNIATATLAVTQSTSPWVDNITQIGGSAIALGQTTMSASLPVVIASNQSVLSTKDAADGPVSPGAAASNSLLIGGVYNSALPTLTTGQQASIQLDSSGRVIISPLSGSSVTVTNLPTTVDTNYGTVGSSTLRSAAQIGNASGAADFNSGATGAQTLRVVANQGAANATPWNENIAQIAGSAPGASNSLPVQISTGSAFVSSSNPLPVIIDPAAAGSPVDDYKDASSIAIGATDNHQYTVTSGKTLHLEQVWIAASGKCKAVISIETGVATGIFTPFMTAFNSTASPAFAMPIVSGKTVAAGVRVQVAMTNNDLLAQDLYSTISGFEI